MTLTHEVCNFCVFLSARLVAHQERVSGRDARRRFDPDGRSPYAYVNVLLYTQQLEAAVAFLNWKGQHFAVRNCTLAASRHRVNNDVAASFSLSSCPPLVEPALRGDPSLSSSGKPRW